MTRRTIRLFMWGYQEHFVSAVQGCAEGVLERIGAPSEAKVMLVGVRRPDVSAQHPVCIEPEGGRWPLALFEGLEQAVEEAIPKHPMSSMYYGDEASMRDKPEWTRQAVVAEQVRARLGAFDQKNDVVSFVRAPTHVGGYDIAIVIQLPKSTLAAHAELQGRGWNDEAFDMSFIRGCMLEVLEAAESQLLRPDPGRGRRDDMRKAGEIVARAGRRFMRQVCTLVDPRVMGEGPFEALNGIASWRYEGDEGLGRMLMVAKDAAIDFAIELETPVRLRETRWVRKLLQIASADLPLIATWEAVFGLGRPSSPDTKAICLDFHGHQDWEVRWGEDLLMRVRLGEPRLPQEAVPEERFLDNVSRLFPEAGPAERRRLWDILSLQARQQHGSLVVIAEDARQEAQRLSSQATPITPVLVTPELLSRASRIDGGLLLDPTGHCCAIGVVLDGEANEECRPSRGARYNSAVRYVHASSQRRMAIVYSDDRTLDIVPLLRPRVARSALADALRELEAATPDDYHRPRYFLDQHRFYLDAKQCERANAAMKRIFATPSEVGELRAEIAYFEPDPAMDDSYLI